MATESLARARVIPFPKQRARRPDVCYYEWRFLRRESDAEWERFKDGLADAAHRFRVIERKHRYAASAMSDQKCAQEQLDEGRKQRFAERASRLDEQARELDRASGRPTGPRIDPVVALESAVRQLHSPDRAGAAEVDLP